MKWKVKWKPFSPRGQSKSRSVHLPSAKKKAFQFFLLPKKMVAMLMRFDLKCTRGEKSRKKRKHFLLAPNGLWRSDCVVLVGAQYGFIFVFFVVVVQQITAEVYALYGFTGLSTAKWSRVLLSQESLFFTSENHFSARESVIQYELPTIDTCFFVLQIWSQYMLWQIYMFNCTNKKLFCTGLAWMKEDYAKYPPQ